PLPAAHLAKEKPKREAFVTGRNTAGVSFVMLRRIGTVSAASVAEVERRAVALDLGAPVSIRINPRARRLLLRIDAALRRVELVLPKGVPLEHRLEFLAAQRGGIAPRLEALPAPVPFAEGAIVPVFGVPHRICRTEDPAA